MMKSDRNSKITVLMPVYNAEKYLRGAIESILDQTFADFEFLIIDDGSTDKSLNIINSYNDPRIKLIRNTKNLGIIKTLNRGLSLAKGVYIARMDADDISTQDRLEKQVNFMDDHLEIGVCGSWVKIFTHFKFLGYVIKLPTNPEDIKLDLRRRNVIQHPSVILRKSLFDEFGLRYLNNFRHAEDYDLWVRASKLFPLANLPEVLLYYRYSPKSVGDLYANEQLVNAKKIGGVDDRSSFSWKVVKKIGRFIAQR